MTATDHTTPHEEIVQFVKEGYFFNACVCIALNKGFKDAIKSKQIVSFPIGDYNVKFNPQTTAFELTHNVYFARIIHAYYNEVVFIGDNEDEVINDLLIELEKPNPCT